MDDEILKTNGLDIKDWDATIYRVMPIFRFKEIIATGQMGLTRPALWDDPFENFYLKCKVRISKTEVASLTSISASWYGQCWTKKRDSDAMWRIYSHNKDGLRVSTTIRRLFSAIYDDKEKFATLMYFIGEVEYAERREIEDFIRRTPFTALSFGAQAAPLRAHALHQTSGVRARGRGSFVDSRCRGQEPRRCFKRAFRSRQGAR